tara:strand:- start:405 stop:638 length:234 start_codon:yes stop_codon:yes gene_type:complete
VYHPFVTVVSQPRSRPSALPCRGNGNTDYIGDDADEMGDNLDPIDLGTDGFGNSLTAKIVSCGDRHKYAILNDDTIK